MALINNSQERVFAVLDLKLKDFYSNQKPLNIHIISDNIRVSNSITIEILNIDKECILISGNNLDLTILIEDINNIIYVELEDSYIINYGMFEIYFDFMGD